MFTNIIPKQNSLTQRLLEHNILREIKFAAKKKRRAIDKEIINLESRTEENKNQNSQFTRYFWSLGL